MNELERVKYFLENYNWNELEDSDIELLKKYNIGRFEFEKCNEDCIEEIQRLIEATPEHIEIQKDLEDYLSDPYAYYGVSKGDFY